jgi:peroxiredoxin
MGECPASDVAAVVLPRLASLPGLAVVAVSQDDPAATRAFAAAHGLRGVTMVLDPEPWPASDAFEVRASPTWFLLDAAGRVATVSEGWSRDDANAMAREAARLTGSPAPTVSSADDPGPAFRPG